MPRLLAGLAVALLAAAQPSPAAEDTRFATLADLARLPWFEAAPDGGVRARPGAYGPVIDCHTHLSLAIGPQRPARLDRRTPRTAHYLDAARPFDLAPYANKNFDTGQLHDLAWDLGLGGLKGGGKRTTHTAPNLAAEMAQLNVETSVLLPIDLPGVSDNAGRFAAAARGFPQLLAFGSVHPRDPQQGARLAEQAARGVKGIKVHPAIQLVAPEDREDLRRAVLHDNAARLLGLGAKPPLPAPSAAAP